MKKKRVSKKVQTAVTPFWKRIDGEYLVEKGRYIDPASIRPSANARDVRESGVTLLYENLKAQGWSQEKGLRVKEMPFGSDGEHYYGCIDGMHRITALKRLRQEEKEMLKRIDDDDPQKEAKKYWTELKVLATVYSATLPRSLEIQIAVEANKSTSVMVKMTVFDMLSSMAEVRKLLMEKHNAQVLEAAEAEGEAESGGKRKRKRGRSPQPFKKPSEVPRTWVTDTSFGKGGSTGSYAKPTIGTFCTLLYRFDGCPVAWEELRSICGSSDTEKAVNSQNLYTSEFSEDLSDGMKYWILRRLVGDYKESGKSLSKSKSKDMMARTIFVLREVEKLCKLFSTTLLEFEWDSAELGKELREGIEYGLFDKEVPRTKARKKAMNENQAILLSSFERLVEEHHGRETLERFQRERLRESSLGGDGKEVVQGEAEDGEKDDGGDEGDDNEDEGHSDDDADDSGGRVEEEGGEIGTEEGLTGQKRSRELGEKRNEHRKRVKTATEKDGNGTSVPSWTSKREECRMFGQSFEDFLGSEEFKKIKGKARLVLTDPPYNILEGEEHDRITDRQMRKLVEGAYHLLCRGGCLLVFCAWQQLSRWNKFLEKAHFKICPVPMHIIMPRNVQRKSNFFQNIVEYCIFAIAKVKEPGDKRVYLRWTTPPVYTTKDGAFPVNSNCLLHNVGPGGEKLMRTKNKPWRTQEKPLALIQELMSRFSPVSSLVVDLFAGTFTTALAALKLGRQFVGCEIDVELFEAAKGRVKAVFDALEAKRKAEEKEAKEREAKEREAKEREAKEREAKEQEAKEQEAKEQEAKGEVNSSICGSESE